MPDDVSNEGKEFDAKLFAARAARAPRPYYREAMNGNKIAAKEVISLLLLELAGHAIRPDIPMSEPALAYLQACLARISRGQDANQAFNLVKKGKTLWSYDQKFVVSQIVYQFVRSGDTVEIAVSKGRDVLERFPLRLTRWGIPFGASL